MKVKEMKRQPRSTAKSSVRAQRFAIKVPVKYRESNQKVWQEGQTENISHSGLLFRAPEPLDPNTMLELNFALPSSRDGERGATVMCDGKTIRTILPATSDEAPGVAVKILNYRLKRTF